MDPCLGVYADPVLPLAVTPPTKNFPTPEILTAAPKQTEDRTNLLGLLQIAQNQHTLRQNTDPEPTSPKVLTVEDFLKQSTEKNGIKTYGKRKLVATLREADMDADYSGTALLATPISL